MKMMTKTITMSPNALMPIPDANSIGYIKGELPFITVHADGERIDVLRGQCIPTPQHHLSVENIFGRTAECQLMFNGPVSLTSAPDDDEFLTYRTGFHLPEVVSETSKLGAGFLLKAGRATLTVNTSTLLEVHMYHNASEHFLAAKPVGFMDDPIGLGEAIAPPRHVSGDEMGNLVFIAGEYDTAAIAGWISGAGLVAILGGIYQGPVTTISTRTYGMTLEIEAGTAVFFVRNKASAETRMEVKIVDRGTHRWDGYV